MKKRYLAALVLPAFLAACASNDSGSNAMVNKSELVSQNWVLTKIDNKAIDTQDALSAPNLQLSADLDANGNAGCNRFFGKAELNEGKLRIEKMGMTMMACQGPEMKVEQVMSKTLMNWSAANVSGNQLTLTGTEHSLTFTRADAK
ncbi:META domain-containing protein [Photobacterium nomapromontoriensis]|uniref:META domain-containing protein n=1 Tax=Photobacterium nomapromontoriensis TaxID=2910237 RepID=UPI003D12D7EF